MHQTVEMAPQLRAFAALPEVRGSIPKQNLKILKKKENQYRIAHLINVN